MNCMKPGFFRLPKDLYKSGSQSLQQQKTKGSNLWRLQGPKTLAKAPSAKPKGFP